MKHLDTMRPERDSKISQEPIQTIHKLDIYKHQPFTISGRRDFDKQVENAVFENEWNLPSMKGDSIQIQGPLRVNNHEFLNEFH